MTKSAPFDRAPLVAFGAHPDDLEFGCGGILARETLLGRPVHLVVCRDRSPSAKSKTPHFSSVQIQFQIQFLTLDSPLRPASDPAAADG